MNIGIIKFTIRLPANSSLKGKRKVVHSLCQKMRNKFCISVAEVESLDDAKTAVVGVSFVSNNMAIIHQLNSQVLGYLQDHAGDYILLDFKQDIISGF